MRYASGSKPAARRNGRDPASRRTWRSRLLPWIKQRQVRARAQSPVGGFRVSPVVQHFLPVNMRISGYCNAVKSEFGPKWQIQTRMQFTFLK